MIRSNNFKDKTYLMYGKHSCLAAINNPKRKIYNIFVTSGFANEHQNLLTNLKYEILSNNELYAMVGSDATHQGIIIKTQALEAKNLKNLTSDKVDAKFLILDQINDPHNLGAIIRSAAAFGIDGIIMPQDNSPKEGAVIAKSACGMLEKVDLYNVVNLTTTIKQLKEDGFWVIGMSADAKDDISSADLTGKIALVLGAEGKGMRRLTQENCDLLVKIPINPEAESINVSNAAAIACYEARRQKLLIKTTR